MDECSRFESDRPDWSGGSNPSPSAWFLTAKDMSIGESYVICQIMGVSVSHTCVWDMLLS